ncbi:secretin receptor-like [Babylonia areolata]|uniref:secretin receptor-like n=1 Tax=Babylonia areolata TaxID=304850 RepID=UPI003FD1784B
MYSDVITTHEQVFLRTFRGGSTQISYREGRCGCSCVLCVVVTTFVLLSVGCVLTLPLVHAGSWSLKKQDVVSVMSQIEQKRLLLIARQACYRLSQQREREIQNGSAPISGLACGVTWDHVLCWDMAKPDTTVTQKCPGYVSGIIKNGVATRHCTVNGTWSVSGEYNKTWTNYSQCVGPDVDLRVHAAHGDRLRLLYTVGYSVSLATLLIAMIIMLCCKRLHSKSNTLHINLFLAFILRAVISFLKDLLFVSNLGLAKDVRLKEDGYLEFIEDNVHWECKLLICTLLYAVSACNMWILAEALYLTMLVQRPLRTERQGVRVYVLLGWLLPFVSLVPWVVVKALYENTFCWNIQHNPYYYWIHRGSGVAVVVINFFLFLNILRKLFMKIRHSSELGTNRKAKYRKLAKFILVLIPLFGIMYIVFYVLVPSGFENNSYNVAYLYVEMAYNSFQGFLLALLFCFLNEEVHGELKRVWYRHQYRKSGDPTAFTRSFAASSYRKAPSVLNNTNTNTNAAAASLSSHHHHHHHPRNAKLLAMHHKLQSFSLASSSSLTSSSSSPGTNGILTAAEKKRARMHRARSHDLGYESLPPDSVGSGTATATATTAITAAPAAAASMAEPHGGNDLLRQALLGNLKAKVSSSSASASAVAAARKKSPSPPPPPRSSEFVTALNGNGTIAAGECDDSGDRTPLTSSPARHGGDVTGGGDGDDEDAMSAAENNSQDEEEDACDTAFL